MEIEIQKIASKIFFPTSVLRINRHGEDDWHFSGRILQMTRNAKINLIIRCVHELFLMRGKIDEEYECNVYLDMTNGPGEHFESTVIVHHLFPHRRIYYEWQNGIDIRLFRWMAEKNMIETTLYTLIMNEKFDFASAWIETKNLHKFSIMDTIEISAKRAFRDKDILKYLVELNDWKCNGECTHLKKFI